MKLCIVTHTVMKGDGQGRVNYEVATDHPYLEKLCNNVQVTAQKYSWQRIAPGNLTLYEAALSHKSRQGIKDETMYCDTQCC